MACTWLCNITSVNRHGILNTRQMFCILLKVSNTSVPFLYLIRTQPMIKWTPTCIYLDLTSGIFIINAGEAKRKQLSTVGIHFQLLISHFCYTPSGPKGQHEAPLPVGERGDLPSLWVWTQVQEAVVCTVLLSQSATGEKKVSHAWMECHLWLQWFWLWSEGGGLLKFLIQNGWFHGKCVYLGGGGDKCVLG